MFKFTSIGLSCVPLAAVLLLLINNWLKRHKYRSLPGPKGLPFIGNPSELQQDFPCLHLAKHKDLYGPISSVTVFGQIYIILNSVEAADDLLNRRSAIYSERPTFNFARLCGHGNQIVLANTGPKLKAHRKSVQQAIGSKNSIRRLTPIFEAESRRFLARFLATPGELRSCLKSYSAALILKVTYGYSMEMKHPDPLIQEIEEYIHTFSLSIEPGVWLVDTLPLLQHIPSWMPGSEFKQTAKAWRVKVSKAVERPYLFVKQQVAAGTACPSYLSTLFDQSSDEPDEFQKHVFKWSAATMYGAASETTLSLLYSYFLAMILYPEVQRKAQAEIDRVIGPNRLPISSDRDELPYVNAVVKEVLRWHSDAPREDDVYKGYFIPKGAVILPNIWLYTHDPSNYHDPFTFKPERFLAVDGFKPEMDPSGIVFGFGGRACLGKKLADSSIFHVVAMSLATLHVGKASDANGVEISPAYELIQTGLFIHPKPFPYSITARCPRAQELIMSIDKEYNVGHNDAGAIQAISLDFMDEE